MADHVDKVSGGEVGWEGAVIGAERAVGEVEDRAVGAGVGAVVGGDGGVGAGLGGVWEVEVTGVVHGFFVKNAVMVCCFLFSGIFLQ